MFQNIYQHYHDLGKIPEPNLFKSGPDTLKLLFEHRSKVRVDIYIILHLAMLWVYWVSHVSFILFYFLINFHQGQLMLFE